MEAGVLWAGQGLHELWYKWLSHEKEINSSKRWNTTHIKWKLKDMGKLTRSWLDQPIKRNKNKNKTPPPQKKKNQTNKQTNKNKILGQYNNREWLNILPNSSNLSINFHWVDVTSVFWGRLTVDFYPTHEFRYSC